MWDKHQIVEEPYDGKLSRTVLKPSRGSDAPAQVNYNYLARCFVLIDLKSGELTHQDLGQMQMYVNYYTRELMNPGDNPPVGIVLCAEKNDAVVRYTLPEDEKQVFAAQYMTYLPTQEELKTLLQEV